MAPGSPASPIEFGDDRYQDHPGQPGFPEYTTDIVSCELPVGAAWLFSSLLELGVAVWRPWNAITDHEWSPLGDGCYRYNCQGDPWSRLAPGLVSGREFRFRPSPVPRFTHAGPGDQRVGRRTILIVRDPRDSLYSAWQRHEMAIGEDGRSEERFIRYAEAPSYQANSSRAEYWDSFHGEWMRRLRQTTDYTILRFEDFKRDPLAELRRICAFLSLEVSQVDAQAAVRVSDFRHVSEVDRDLVKRGVFSWTINRAGTPDEHLSTYTLRMHDVFRRRDGALWRELGYERSR